MVDTPGNGSLETPGQRVIISGAQINQTCTGVVWFTSITEAAWNLADLFNHIPKGGVTLG